MQENKMYVSVEIKVGDGIEVSVDRDSAVYLSDVKDRLTYEEWCALAAAVGRAKRAVDRAVWGGGD